MQILFKGKRLKEEIISLFEPCFLELRLAILEMNMQHSVAVFSLFVSVLGGHNVKRSTHDRSGIIKARSILMQIHIRCLFLVIIVFGLLRAVEKQL